MNTPRKLPPSPLRKGDGAANFRSAAVAFLFGAGFCLPASAQHEHHAAPAAEAGAPALFTPSDLQFLHHMILHHRQAIDMGALVAERTDRERFERFARYVADAQHAEIRMMDGMLEMAAARGAVLPAHDMSGDPPMAGMLSTAELAALEAATGAQFERLWIEGMIFHHEGGLAMARVQQLQQFAEGRRPPGLEVMVEHILDVQRAEISMMQGFIEDWGLGTDGADVREPAVEATSPAPGVVLAAGREATIYGVAVDDRDVAGVEVAIEDLASGAWLRADGTWGERELHAATTVGSGPASTAWSFAFTPPAAGRYAVVAEAEDGAGKRGVSADLELGVE